MDLLIIGNGFDLAHNLPTSYWDFREFLNLAYSEFLRTFEERYDLYPGINDDIKRNTLWNQFETNLANIDEESIIDEATSIEMGLESGDVDIVDTLVEYFERDYDYINRLTIYLKRWVRTIRIRDAIRKTSRIEPANNSMFLNFNYTSVLERVYGINRRQIIHIHGSLHNYDDPILGHGNQERLDRINEKIHIAENEFDEKQVSICRVIRDYYQRTYKDIYRYQTRLISLQTMPIDRIFVIGHSLSGVDMPYFEYIDLIKNRTARWIVYYFRDNERDQMEHNLELCGINTTRRELRHAREFYDL